MKEITFQIPLCPITKKNSQRICRKKNGQSFIMPSQKYKDYEKAALFFLPKLSAPLDSVLNVKCIFYMQTRRRVDLTNLLESIDDIMVTGGVILDDNSRIVAAHDGSRVRYDKDHPRTEVTISELIE